MKTSPSKEGPQLGPSFYTLCNRCTHFARTCRFPYFYGRSVDREKTAHSKVPAVWTLRVGVTGSNGNCLQRAKTIKGSRRNAEHALRDFAIEVEEEAEKAGRVGDPKLDGVTVY